MLVNRHADLSTVFYTASFLFLYLFLFLHGIERMVSAGSRAIVQAAIISLIYIAFGEGLSPTLVVIVTIVFRSGTFV